MSIDYQKSYLFKNKKCAKKSSQTPQYHAKHQNMSQFGKTPRHVIAKDHVPNIRASRIDGVTASWTMVRVDAIVEVKSVSISVMRAL